MAFFVVENLQSLGVSKYKLSAFTTKEESTLSEESTLDIIKACSSTLQESKAKIKVNDEISQQGKLNKVYLQLLNGNMQRTEFLV